MSETQTAPVVVVQADPPEPAEMANAVDASVAIAAIQADATVAVAEAERDARIGEAEAHAAVMAATTQEDEDLAWFQNEFARLHERMDALQNAMMSHPTWEQIMERLDRLTERLQTPPTSPETPEVILPVTDPTSPAGEDGPRESPEENRAHRRFVRL